MTPVVVLLALAPLFWLSLVEFASRAPKRTWGAGLSALMATGFLAGALVQLQELLAQRPSPHVMLATGAFALLVGHAYALRLVTVVGIATTGYWVAGLVARVLGGRWEDAYDAPERAVLVGALAFLVGAVGARRLPPRLAPLWRVTGLVAVLGTLLALAFGLQRATGDPGPVAWQLVTFAVAAAAMAGGARAGWRDTIHAGAGAMLVLAVTKVVQWFWGDLPPTWFFTLTALVMLLVLLVTLRLRPPERERRAP